MVVKLGGGREYASGSKDIRSYHISSYLHAENKYQYFELFDQRKG